MPSVCAGRPSSRTCTPTVRDALDAAEHLPAANAMCVHQVIVHRSGTPTLQQGVAALISDSNTPPPRAGT